LARVVGTSLACGKNPRRLGPIFRGNGYILNITNNNWRMNMLLDLLRKRYSCRNFSDRKISKEIINYMLECGRLSPSGGNEQPWKFGVITDSDVIKKFLLQPVLIMNKNGFLVRR